MPETKDIENALSYKHRLFQGFNVWCTRNISSKYIVDKLIIFKYDSPLHFIEAFYSMNISVI